MDASSAPAGIGHNQPSLADALQIEFSDLLDTVQKLRDKANAVKAVVDEKGINSDDDIVPMVEVGREATKLLSSLKNKKLDRTKPLRDDVDTINRFFETVMAQIDRIKTAFAGKVGAYEDAKREQQKREAAERARLAEEEAARKLKEAEEARHSVMGDVILNEAIKAEEEAQMAANAAVKAGTGPTRTDAGTVSQSGKWTMEIIDASKIPPDVIVAQLGLADIEKAMRAHVRQFRDTRPVAGVRFFQETKTSFR